MAMQMEMKKLELEERKVALQEQKAMADVQMDQERLALEKSRSEMEVATKYSEEERKDFDSETSADVAYKELELAKKIGKENQTAIISPNS
jgi:hypothetical protein